MIAKLVIALLAVTVVSGDLTCPVNWVNGLTRCYFFSSATASNWYTALQACDDMGGHLLSIESEAEQQSLTNHIKSQTSLSENRYWLSLTNTVEGGSYGWYGTMRLSVYMDFCSASGDSSVNHCAVMDPDCGFSWTTCDCADSGNYYICEKDIVHS